MQDYGAVPKYLQQRKEEQQRAQKDFEDFVKEHREQGGLTNLSEDRRQAVLEVVVGTGDWKRLTLANCPASVCRV